MSNNNNSDNSDNNDCSPPPPTYDELKACQFSSWYTTFRNLHKIPSELLDDHDRDTKSDSNTNTNTNNNNNNNNNLLLKRRKKSYPYNNVTIRSIIIKPLPLNFIEYLQSDGIILPIGAEKVSSFLPDVVNNSNNDEYNCDWSSSSEGDMNIGNHEDNEDNESDASNEGNEGNELNDNLKNKNNQNQNQYHFPELNDKIQKALDTLGPSIPKLNWSCPKDVTWVNAETLKCSTVGDVYLLLKSSDFCMFDLTHALDGVQVSDNDGDINGDGGDDTGNTNGGDEDVKQNSFEYELILRKWSNLHASMEFRCFVSNHEIVAISQRNHTQHFPHLKKDYMTIRSHIVDFFNDTIQYTYSYNANVNNNDNENENVNNENSNNNKSIPVSNYTFDVYVDKSNRVWLIDFNVWAERTDSLLFKWDELMQMAADVHVTSIDKDTNKNTDMNESSNANTSNVEEKEEDINLDNIHVETNEKEHDDDDDDDDDDDKIITIENIKPEIRVVRNANEVLYDPLSSYRAPIDTVDLASDNVGSHTFQDFMAMCQRPSAMSDSDSDSDSSDDES